ncbi:MAG: bifunctional pyr operon transcriptional regulator/uracil phosphoribosyltransferase PyrR [Gammaproteobacteria bacterium]|nr:bifunctional pyr operon transcriptional regulator/uracil phosphoribosyltransferase PyrR [Gammaproteobacteria bacterium]
MSPTQIDIESTISRMADSLKLHLKEREIDNPLIIGIQTGGLWVAEKIRSSLGISEANGVLNIAFYRDDFSRIGLHPRVSPSSLPFEIEDKHIILVDDVLHTGRTIRAAMNEIFDFGRPASITLVVLIDRNGRELPVEANISGKRLELNKDEHVKLLGPEPLALEFK